MIVDDILIRVCVNTCDDLFNKHYADKLQHIGRNGHISSIHVNLNTADTCPVTWVLQSLDVTVVGSDQGGGRREREYSGGDRAVGWRSEHQTGTRETGGTGVQARCGAYRGKVLTVSPECTGLWGDIRGGVEDIRDR